MGKFKLFEKSGKDEGKAGAKKANPFAKKANPFAKERFAAGGLVRGGGAATTGKKFSGTF